MPTPTTQSKGFTLAELLISIAVMVLVGLLFSTTFILNQRVLRQTNQRSELQQNARIISDRMSREIRQAITFVTTLPEDDSDPDQIAHELEFEDGHIDTQIQYIRFFLDGTDLRRQIKVYELGTTPGISVHWNDTDALGAATATILEDKLMAEYVTTINFFGSETILVEMTLEKNGQHSTLETAISPRNE